MINSLKYQCNIKAFFSARAKVILIIIASSILQITSAQTSKDTISIAQELSEKQDFLQAISMLKQFIAHHPTDYESHRLLGYCYYWSNDFIHAKQTPISFTIISKGSNTYARIRKISLQNRCLCGI